jgi:hypothetical protein
MTQVSSQFRKVLLDIDVCPIPTQKGPDGKSVPKVM